MADLEKPIRAFIAINLPESLRRALEKRQKDLQTASGGRAVRWVPVKQIHLTVRFLGNVPADAPDAILVALQRAVTGMSPLSLSAQGMGCFPTPRQPRIIWVGITGDVEALQTVFEAVARETAPWGEMENKPFHPHLTLGRVQRELTREARKLTESFAKSNPPGLGHWQAAQLDLMQSRLSPAGAEYHCLGTVPLPANSSPKS